NSWLYRYDDYHSKKTSIHPTGVFEEEYFDKRGRCTHHARFDPLGKVLTDKEYNYDPAGNCTRIFEKCFGGSKESITTIFTYGECNRLQELIEGFNNPEEKKTSYTYNHHGQLEKITHCDGNTIHYSYDTKG